jgi:hypothetical protein
MKVCRHWRSILVVALALVLVSNCGRQQDKDLAREFFRKEGDFKSLLELARRDAEHDRIAPISSGPNNLRSTPKTGSDTVHSLDAWGCVTAS